MATKSTPKPYTQPQLTKIFAATANVPTVDLSTLRYRLWFNPVEQNSLRLSLEGYRFVVQNLKLQTYEFELEKPLTNKNLLQLERYFQSIYYIVKKKIIVFDDKEAVMLTLHANDLPAYLDNLETNQVDQ